MATGGNAPDAAVNKLKCAVCLEKYRRPKLLPCFHTFCQSCLQAVAGPSPSFPCPACRTPILLPPGGVAALQTNSYIVRDLATDSTPTVRLCDVCTEDREATHTCLQCQQRYCPPCRRFHDSITSCRSHTVVPLRSDNEDGGNLNENSSVQEREEFCLKHRNQPVILHCTACKSNMCMQCKLTSHEGHPTEDLADTGEKVKARVQNKLEMMVQQRRNTEGLLFDIDDKRRLLQSLHETIELEIKDRKETVRRWADECEEKALKNLQSLRDQMMTSLSVSEEGVQHKRAAISAQYDYATRVLLEGKDTNIVLLEDQLKEISFDPSEVSQLLNSLGNKPFTCEHDPLSVSTAHLQGYIGIMKRSASKPKTDSSETSAGSGVHTDDFTEVIYSENPKSKIVAICSAPKNRVWIKYQPSGQGEMMGLFDANGLVESLDDVLGNPFITLSNDITVGNGVRNQCSWIQTDGTMRNAETDFSFIGVPKCANMTFLATIYRGGTYQISRCSVTSVNPFNWSVSTVLELGQQLKVVKDVSTNGRYVASLNKIGDLFQLEVDLYKNAQSGNLRQISSYSPAVFGRRQDVLDACFISVEDKELLFAVVDDSDAYIHVVDHADGCGLVHRLATENRPYCLTTENWPYRLTTENRPYRLATDREKKVLWIGCHGGKVIQFEDKPETTGEQ